MLSQICPGSSSKRYGYPGLKQAQGLGPIGEAYTRGLWAHQTLAVKVHWQRDGEQLLGLLGQKVWARPATSSRGKGSQSKSPRGKHGYASRQARESQRWMAAMQQTGGAMHGTTWTYVADRESDIYELFQSAWAHGWSYVIRAAQPRALRGQGMPKDLLAAAAAAPLRGVCHVPPREGRPEMALRVRSTTLALRGPSRPASGGGSGGRLEDHTLNVVHAVPCDPPADGAPVCWTLLTDLPVDTLEQCQRVLAIYRRRWLVEELHKALKTGLKVEHSQLSDARRLGALVGILSVVAVFLLQQKLAARDEPEAELDERTVDAATLAVLRKTDPPAAGQSTRRWFWIAIAKLGGYHPRRGTNPGWLTLWRGWQTLMLLTRGYELARAP